MGVYYEGSCIFVLHEFKKGSRKHSRVAGVAVVVVVVVVVLVLVLLVESIWVRW